MKQEIVIVAAARTAVGAMGGSLVSVPAVELGKIAIEEAIKRSGVPKEAVAEVILGNVLQAGLGQNPARQAAVHAGIPMEVPSFSINKVCGSGLKAVMLAAQAIAAGDAEVVIAGGMENMSVSPYLVPNARWGYRMNNGELVDSMIKDGLSCAFNQYHMGITAENVAEKYQITREAQDIFSAASQLRAEVAIKNGRFKDEVVAVPIKQKRETVVFDTDEFPRFGTTAEKLGNLKPAFKKEGTVTAGNASGINDGAAAIVVMSGSKAQEVGAKPLARIVSYATAGVDPSLMGTGPIPATRKALEKAGLKVGDLDLIEANEAFAAQALAVTRKLGLDPEKTNVNGGAIALGHPIGASGARILVTLLYEMKKRAVRYGLATLCIGGGQGAALIVERID